jgi:AcrR family transcriptional regulator
MYYAESCTSQHDAIRNEATETQEAVVTKSGSHIDGRTERGNQTRDAVLPHAVEIVSMEGLEALSLGRLASGLGISKSGVFALFGSKEAVQLATVRTATDIYFRTVVKPSMEASTRVGRLWALCENWLAYSRNKVFPGGCFFFAVSAEFDTKPGKVHDRIARSSAVWNDLIKRTIEEAKQVGELVKETDPPQLAFELVALLEAANGSSLLHNDPAVYTQAERALLDQLRPLVTDRMLLPAKLAIRPSESDRQ